MTLGQLADRISAAIWNLHPQWAVAVGRHEYDGQVPDLSAGAVEAGLERLGRLRDQLDGLADLAPEEQQEREVLRGVIDRERGDGERVVRWRRDPGWYPGALDISVYLERDYAPAGLRLERAAAILGEAGGLLFAARENLSREMPRAWVEHAVAQARRRAAEVVAQAEWAPEGRDAPAEAAWLREAAGFAAAELTAYAAWLEAERLPVASGDEALGREGLEEWLRAAEGLDWTAGDLVSVGADCLGQDSEALAEATARGQGRGAAGSDRGPDPVAALRQCIDEARRFVAAAGLAGLPGAAGVRVSAGPRRGGGDGAWLEAPGPYDDPATTPVVYLDPGEPAWGPGRLDDLAVTLAYPGRLLQAWHAATAAGEARRRFPSLAFREGWALYSGDLMAEAGYGERRPEWRRAALERAVREDCRLVCVAGLHGAGMTRHEAGEVFARQAGLDPVAARAAALGCAVRPEMAAAALGRAAFLRLRARRGAPPGEFHDALLRLGAVPLGLLDRLAP